METYEAIHSARVALLAALDGTLDEAELEDAVRQAQSSRYGHEGMCGHSMYLRARQALKWVCILTQQAAVEVGFLRVEQAESIVQGCKKINLPLADADTLKQFLALPREQQCRRQVEAALDQDSHELQVWRAIECSISEMDEFFRQVEEAILCCCCVLFRRCRQDFARWSHCLVCHAQDSIVCWMPLLTDPLFYYRRTQHHFLFSPSLPSPACAFSSAENMAQYSWHNFENLMERDIWAKKNGVGWFVSN